MTLEEMRKKLEEINVAGLPIEHLKTLSEQADSYDLNLSRSAEELANFGATRRRDQQAVKVIKLVTAKQY